MAGNSSRRGAVRTAGSKKGPLVGSGGQRRRGLEGKGPTPKAADRPNHKAYQQSGKGSSGGGQSGVLSQLAFLQSVTGVVAVTGPGLTVTLDDSADAVSGADAARGSSGFEAGRVSAADLQIVSNGLWAAGAEAISINGQRLTTRSAIRFAGQAILVDFRPLVRPYVVTAIGDAKALQSSFGSSPTGSYLKSLEDNYGIPVAISGSASLTCPAC